MQDKLNPGADFSDPARPAIYVHVPFCARPCSYCKFYKQRPTHSDIEAYLDALENEAETFFSKNDGLKPISVFFGGGTPTSLNEKQLERLCRNFSQFDSVSEWTIEASPSTVNENKLKALRGMGVNRLSLGIQSFSESTLRELGRAHSTDNGLKAIDAGLNVFENMNVDLIFGSPGQTEEMWRADLQKAVSYPLKHISAYCIEFESATSCCAGLEKSLPDQERETDFLDITIETLGNSSFKHYEISNYAKVGYECLQNINTWRMGSWIGFGPSAASQFGGFRYKNPDNLQLWLKNVKNESFTGEDIIKLDDKEMLSCALIFGLRIMRGIDFEFLKRRFPAANSLKFQIAVEKLAEEGLLEREGSVISLSRRGISLADSVASEFL